jgi:hypothetical protein
VAVQLGQVSDPTHVRGLVEDHDHRRVDPAAVPLGGAHGLTHHPVGQRRDQRRGRAGAVLGQQVQALARPHERRRVELGQLAALARRHPRHDLAVPQALSRRPGRLVHPVACLRRPVLAPGQARGCGLLAVLAQHLRGCR